MLNDTFAVGKSKVRLVKGDITDMAADAIVNAANSTLMGGAGVDGAIHRKGGPQILQECRKIRAREYPAGLPTGKAVITGAGKLKAKKVIHAVGPMWHGGDRDEPDLLKQAYENSLRLAIANGLKTVAFPSISTGAYGYPLIEASYVALGAVREFLEREDKFDEIVFVLFSGRDLKIYLEAAERVLRE